MTLQHADAMATRQPDVVRAVDPVASDGFATARAPTVLELVEQRLQARRHARSGRAPILKLSCQVQVPAVRITAIESTRLGVRRTKPHGCAGIITFTNPVRQSITQSRARKWHAARPVGGSPPRCNAAGRAPTGSESK